MFVIWEEIDDSIYLELVVNPSEVDRLKENEMICAEKYLNNKKHYISVRLKGVWDVKEERNQRSEKNKEGFS